MTMEAHDFEMPSPKRQRTNSPSEQMPTPAARGECESETIAGNVQQPEVSNDIVAEANCDPITASRNDTSSRPVVSTEESSDMLDVLMQHVEAESAPVNSISIQATEVEDAPATGAIPKAQQQDSEMGGVSNTEAAAPAAAAAAAVAPALSEPLKPNNTAASEIAEATVSNAELPPGLEPAPSSIAEDLHSVAAANGLPPTADTLAQTEIPPATAGNGAETAESAAPREWETDSSPYDSSDSSDTSSDDDDSSSEDNDADDYTLLDPYEQARILMAEDGGGGGMGGAPGDDSGDEDGTNSKPKTGGSGPRTVNEKPEDIMPKPNIQITEQTVIEELGHIEGIVENTALIKAKVSGEYQVLQEGSVLCLPPPTRTVIGAVADTLGQVLQPLYTVRFASNQDVVDTFGLSTGPGSDSIHSQIKGVKIFYVKDHSTFVFTQPLKAVRGSDASNFHDEEVGDDEMEFSDDEAEAEHKRRQKLLRKGIDPNSQPGRGRSSGRGLRAGRGGSGGGMRTIPESDMASVYSMGNSSVDMNYDDVEEGETSAEYTPLRRPEAGPHGAVNSQMPPPQQTPPNSAHGSYTQHRGGGRPRGNHSTRARGGRGHYQNNRGGNYNSSNTNASQSPNSTTSMYNQPQQQGYYSSPNQQTQYFGFQAPPPPPPQLTPASGPYMNGGTNIPPSPMTPLPGGNFNFQAQAQWAQYHQNQANQYAVQQAQYGQGANAEALAQVQRQLEELRRHAQGQ